MIDREKNSKEESFIEKFEQLSLKLEQLTDGISKMETKLDKAYKMNRSFGLKSLKNSEPLDFSKEVIGMGSPTKRYALSIRAITEEWKGRKNDFLILIRQQEKETHQDLKALGIRLPVNDLKNISLLAQNVISLLYVACELKGVQITEILREILEEVNDEGNKMVQEIKEKMVL